MQHRNRDVPTGWLIEELWGDSSPHSALATLQTYIYQLRKFLAGCLGTDRATEMLQTKPAGYRLRVRDEDVDDGVFGDLVDQASGALQEGELHRTVELARSALDQWRGPALADVQKGPLLEAYSAQLQEDRLRAIELRIDAELQLGRHRELISELKALTVMYALNEGLHGKLMLALYAADRRSEALETFQRLRATLVRELGLEPTDKVQRLHQAILDGSIKVGPEPGRGAAPSRSRAIPPPAQLPPDIGDFIGRDAELDEIRRRFEEGLCGGALPVVGILGTEGIGKTAMAVRSARQMRAEFPDAQFYVSYRAGRMSPGDVLYGFLRAVGFGEAQIPDDLDERSRLFRSWTAERRALVVLDDVAEAEEVTPLLPGSDACAVIVTSRAPVRGLSGVRYVRLDALSIDDSLLLLRHIVGAPLVDGEPRSARGHLAGCAGVPRRIRELGDEMLSPPENDLVTLPIVRSRT